MRIQTLSNLMILTLPRLFLKSPHVWRAGQQLLAVLAMSGLLVNTTAASDVKVGGIVIVKPKYEGSDEYEVVGAPFAFPVWSSNGADGTFSFNGVDDVRLRVLNRHGFEAGILGGYAFGRDEDDGDLLVGLGDVDGGFIAGGFVGYRLGNTRVDVSYHRIVSGDTGAYFRAGITHTQDVSLATKLKIRTGVTYADDDYMSHYFGVPTGLGGVVVPAFDADAGFKDVFVNLSATHALTSRWSVTGGVGYKRLIGDAADSPIVESEDQFSATIGATYRFSLR